MVPDGYEFYSGENVIIIASGQWEGEIGKVVIDPNREQSSDGVVVVSLLNWDAVVGDTTNSPHLYFNRAEVALWEHPTEQANDIGYDLRSQSISSIDESRKRLNDILRSLKVGESKVPPSTTAVQKQKFLKLWQRLKKS